MDCKQVRLIIHGYVDGEIDAITMARIESHANNCADCQRRLSEQATLRAAINTASPYYTAPASLQQRIQAGLRASKIRRWPAFSHNSRWLSLSAVTSSVAVLSLGVALLLTTPSSDELLAREIVASHIRSLMVDHLTDVQSTDQHTVKPWFMGQLDFSPPVDDLAAKGFLLVGGRMDYIDNRQVAALVYKRRKHVINLFIAPATDEHTINIRTQRRQGYAIYEWTKAGMHFWAVSDVSESDLAQFVHLSQAASATIPGK